MIRYCSTLDDVSPDHLVGFFVGWPDPPSPQTHLRILRGSYAFVLAVDDASGRVVGFVTAVSDGVLSAYIPLLEVLPGHRRQGIGTMLVNHLLERLESLYMVDLTCDEALQPFYARLGLLPAHAMVLRRYDCQSGRQ